MLPAIVAAIEREGSIGFDRYQELALYGPGGFFEAGAGAGRRSDFLTSAEVGPLFGEVIARALDGWWDELERPEPFVVVEAGAGVGRLARAVLAAEPRCASALRYVLVERSPVLRRAQERILTLTDPALSFAGVGDDDEESDRRRPPPGPIVTSLSELPTGPFVGVVLANELLDNLPVRIAEKNAAGWSEIRVTLTKTGGGDDALCELSVPLAEEASAHLDRLVPVPLEPGSRVPIAVAARNWLRDAGEIVDRGRVVVVDYGETTATLGRRGGWLRTYRDHDRGADPYLEPGCLDITSDVPLDQLDPLGSPDIDVDQASFLRGHGIEDLVAEGRRIWAERAAIGDLAAMRARSRIGESEALLDPAGLGGFRVLGWRIGRQLMIPPAGADSGWRGAPGGTLPSR
ncbi:MAG: SAM-dependent methyltransferase [Acidimicrobiales bacterium]